jgi:hypothetical protein
VANQSIFESHRVGPDTVRLKNAPIGRRFVKQVAVKDLNYVLVQRKDEDVTGSDDHRFINPRHGESQKLSDWSTICTMEKVAVKNLNYVLVERPRCDEHRYINRMNRDSVTDEMRSELDRTLLMSPYYRANVCTCIRSSIF